LDGVYMTTSIPDDEKSKLKEMSGEEKFVFYMENNSEAEDEVREKLEDGTTVLLDRYLASTVAYRNADKKVFDGEDRDFLDAVKESGAPGSSKSTAKAGS
ncbi:MAG: hypothetical protein ABEK01_03385, partial [Candidatus Nanohaloarchaea archaeon]